MPQNRYPSKGNSSKPTLTLLHPSLLLEMVGIPSHPTKWARDRLGGSKPGNIVPTHAARVGVRPRTHQPKATIEQTLGNPFLASFCFSCKKPQTSAPFPLRSWKLMGCGLSTFLGCFLLPCYKLLTFSGLMENPLVGKS